MSRSSFHEPALFRRPGLLGLPLVLLCALAYLGSMAHFVLVQHRTCLAHGELVHAGVVFTDGTPARVQASSEDERITRSEALESVELADAHCAHAFVRRVLPPPAEVMSLPLPPLPPEQIRVLSHVCVEPPVAWLHLAPKSSPPQV